MNKVIAVSSAKGGVGKSTIAGEVMIFCKLIEAVNLALALSKQGLSIGLLDTDIFGPSVPKLLDISGEPEIDENNCLLPMQNYGLKAMSMGFLIQAESTIAWRGLMVMKALQQLLHEVTWGSLDVLVLDMPPGTGDVQLTITQQVLLDGAIIVSTPQDIALIDAVRGIELFKKTDTRILGLVQNMSFFQCPNCEHQTHIFGKDGVVKEAKRQNLDIIGDIPLHADICRDADKGKPTVMAQPNGLLTRCYTQLASNVTKMLNIPVET